MADSFTDDGDGDAFRPAVPLPRARDATPLLDDPNDDFCRVCGFGVRCLRPINCASVACMTRAILAVVNLATTFVRDTCLSRMSTVLLLTYCITLTNGLQGDMLCCETCPATFHKECVGLKALPEGDWWCPQCVCVVCGQARFEHKPLPSSAKQVSLVAIPHQTNCICCAPGTIHWSLRSSFAHVSTQKLQNAAGFWLWSLTSHSCLVQLTSRCQVGRMSSG